MLHGRFASEQSGKKGTWLENPQHALLVMEVEIFKDKVARMRPVSKFLDRE
jgi:hypothetical protein